MAESTRETFHVRVSCTFDFDRKCIYREEILEDFNVTSYRSHVAITDQQNLLRKVKSIDEKGLVLRRDFPIQVEHIHSFTSPALWIHEGFDVYCYAMTQSKSPSHLQVTKIIFNSGIIIKNHLYHFES